MKLVPPPLDIEPEKQEPPYDHASYKQYGYPTLSLRLKRFLSCFSILAFGCVFWIVVGILFHIVRS